MKDVYIRLGADDAYEIVMRPDTAIEVMVLETMSVRVEVKPACLKMTYYNGEAVVSVEKL